MSFPKQSDLSNLKQISRAEKTLVSGHIWKGWDSNQQFSDSHPEWWSFLRHIHVSLVYAVVSYSFLPASCDNRVTTTTTTDQHPQWRLDITQCVNVQLRRQWWWPSWWSGRFRHQRSAVQIPTLAKSYLPIVHWNRKDYDKEKEARNGPYWKTCSREKTRATGAALIKKLWLTKIISLRCIHLKFFFHLWKSIGIFSSAIPWNHVRINWEPGSSQAA